jgi:hypothetical protein
MPSSANPPYPYGKETLGSGILLKILRDIDLTRDALLKLL